MERLEEARRGLSPSRLDRQIEKGLTRLVNVTLFGYPRTGKTTFFNLLTGAHIGVGAFGEGKPEPHARSCSIPDHRLDRIAALYPDRKKVQAAFDLADLVGISYGEVKASLLLGHLRNADALVHVVRGFHDEGIPHPKGRIDAGGDIRIMEEELVLADLVLVESRRERLEKDLKKAKDPEWEREKDLIDRLLPALQSGQGIRALDLPPSEEKLVRSFAFLSQKPLLHVVNMDEADAPYLSQPLERLGIPAAAGRRIMAFCGKIEIEIGELENEEKALFMKEYGIREPSTERFLGQVLDFQDRITFFTVGKDEVRAWAVRKDSTAVKAAGAVHTDIEKGFIKAEVISWENLLSQGSLHKAKEAGAIRLEGKEYLVRDGDVIYFRFAQ